VNANFQVNAANGSSDSQTDTTSFDAVANPGLFFAFIRVTANGSYASTGPGQNSVELDALLSLTELGANEMYDGGGGDDGRIWTADLVTTPDLSNGKSDSQGDWSGLASINNTFVFPLPDDNLHISMSNDVIAITGAGGSAQINVQYQDLKIEFGIIPEPASLSLMGLGAVALMLRRRR